MNLITLIILTLLAAALTAIISAAVKNKKQGKPSCACGGDCTKCSHCGQ